MLVVRLGTMLQLVTGRINRLCVQFLLLLSIVLCYSIAR